MDLCWENYKDGKVFGWELYQNMVLSYINKTPKSRVSQLRLSDSTEGGLFQRRLGMTTYAMLD